MADITNILHSHNHQAPFSFTYHVFVCPSRCIHRQDKFQRAKMLFRKNRKRYESHGWNGAVVRYPQSKPRAQVQLNCWQKSFQKTTSLIPSLFTWLALRIELFSTVHLNRNSRSEAPKPIFQHSRGKTLGFCAYICCLLPLLLFF